MGPVSGIVVFLLVWWTALFAVLPFTGKRDVDGKPIKANIKKLLLINTAVTIMIWLLIFGLIEADIISFRELAEQMAEEDHTT